MTKLNIRITCKTAAHIDSVADLKKQSNNYSFRVLQQGMTGMTAWMNVLGTEQLVRDAIHTIPGLAGLSVAIAESV